MISQMPDNMINNTFDTNGEAPKLLNLVTPQEHWKSGNLLRKCIGFKNFTWIYETILILKVEQAIERDYEANFSTWLTFVREDGSVVRELWHNNHLARSNWTHYDLTRNDDDEK
jgi:hypothetical protein